MINTDKTIITTDKDSIDFYKDVLSNFVINKSAKLSGAPDKIDDYIALFSLYLCNNDAAYKYNLPFLTHQHKKFVKFLITAQDKCTLLRKSVEILNTSKKINNYIKNNPKEKNNISISINEFLISDLEKTITFHDVFSFSGAQRRNNENVLTITTKKDGRMNCQTYKIPVKENNQTYIDPEKFISISEKIICVVNTNPKGGIDNGVD